MNPATGLSEDMEEFSFIIIVKIGIVRFTQSNTESVVKIIRKVEERFAGFDEIKVQAGK